MVPQAVKDLLTSEKGLAGGLLIIGATVLVALGKMTSDMWVNYTEWIFGIYVAGKSATGVAATIASGRPSVGDAAAAAAAVPTATASTENK